MKHLGLIIYASIVAALIALLLYSDIWGKRTCNAVGGNWISMDYGKHCVDDDFNKIDLTP